MALLDHNGVYARNDFRRPRDTTCDNRWLRIVDGRRQVLRAGRKSHRLQKFVRMLTGAFAAAKKANRSAVA